MLSALVPLATRTMALAPASAIKYLRSARMSGYTGLNRPGPARFGRAFFTNVPMSTKLSELAGIGALTPGTKFDTSATNILSSMLWRIYSLPSRYSRWFSPSGEFSGLIADTKPVITGYTAPDGVTTDTRPSFTVPLPASVTQILPLLSSEIPMGAFRPDATGGPGTACQGYRIRNTVILQYTTVNANQQNTQ